MDEDHGAESVAVRGMVGGGGEGIDRGFDRELVEDGAGGGEGGVGGSRDGRAEIDLAEAAAGMCGVSGV